MQYPPKPDYPPETGIPVPGTASPFQIQPHEVRLPWSTGLCDCGDNVGNCCMTFFCPCVTFGRIAEIVDRGSSSCGVSGLLYALLMGVVGWQCLYSCFYRTKMRGQYGLLESPCADCLVHFFCEPCALCQEYRELQARGFVMTIGWHANMERPQGREGASLPPSVPGGMYR